MISTIYFASPQKLSYSGNFASVVPLPHGCPGNIGDSHGRTRSRVRSFLKSASVTRSTSFPADMDALLIKGRSAPRVRPCKGSQFHWIFRSELTRTDARTQGFPIATHHGGGYPGTGPFGVQEPALDSRRSRDLGLLDPGRRASVCVEPKSMADLVGCCCGERARFERELHRLRGFRFARVLIVGIEGDIPAHRYTSRISPKVVLHTVRAFEARYDVPFVWQPNAEAAAALVEQWAWWFSRELLKTADTLRAGMAPVGPPRSSNTLVKPINHNPT
jgi:hypothetical protein